MSVTLIEVIPLQLKALALLLVMYFLPQKDYFFSFISGKKLKTM